MSASKADALPLGDAPIFVIRNSFTLKITRCVCSASQGYMGWVKGLEPSTLGTTIRCSNQLSYTHHIHVMTAIAVFVVRAEMAGTAGFEPANVGVKGRCLTAWRRPHIRHSKQLYPKDNALRLQRVTGLYGVGKGTRTLDPRNHNPML